MYDGPSHVLPPWRPRAVGPDIPPVSGPTAIPGCLVKSPAKRAILSYLRTLADALGLAGWRFDLDGVAGEHEWASIAVERAQQVATLSLSPDLWAQPARDQRHYLAHELIHIHLAPLDWSFEDVTAGLSRRARQLAEATWRQRSERACDDVARLVAPGLPLPPWTP